MFFIKSYYIFSVFFINIVLSISWLIISLLSFPTCWVVSAAIQKVHIIHDCTWIFYFKVSGYSCVFLDCNCIRISCWRSWYTVYSPVGKSVATLWFCSECYFIALGYCCTGIEISTVVFSGNSTECIVTWTKFYCVCVCGTECYICYGNILIRHCKCCGVATYGGFNWSTTVFTHNSYCVKNFASFRSCSNSNLFAFCSFCLINRRNWLYIFCYSNIVFCGIFLYPNTWCIFTSLYNIMNLVCTCFTKIEVVTFTWTFECVIRCNWWITRNNIICTIVRTIIFVRTILRLNQLKKLIVYIIICNSNYFTIWTVWFSGIEF